MPDILNLFAETPVSETWNWLTDVMTTRNGTESRMSLRPTPRSTLGYEYVAVDQDDRRVFTEIFARDLKLPSTVPVWPFSSRVTATAVVSATKVFFDPIRAQLASGGIIVFFNPFTRVAVEYVVDTMDADGANLTASLTEEITTDFYAIKGVTGLIANNNGFSWNQITGTASVDVSSWVENDTVREDNAETVNTLDSISILERTFMAGVDEKFTFPRDIIDFDIGLRTISTTRERVDISGTRKFKVDRGMSGDGSDYDYWTVFLDTVRGSWKPFLLSSQLEDMTLNTTLVAAGTTMEILELYSDELFQDYDAYKHFEIIYTDGTSSEHTITNSVDNTTHVTVTFDPALPNDAKVASVTRISYLLKVRMSDQIKWTHFPLESEVSFDIVTTDNG